MARLVPLDAGVIGLICSSPRLFDVQTYWKWVWRLEAAKIKIAIPEITCYEVRRELLRINAAAKLHRLGSFRQSHEVIPVDEPAWEQAARFWALVRRAGKPTAHPEALDADAILAAVAWRLRQSGHLVTIATTNQRHVGWFPGVNARSWMRVS